MKVSIITVTFNSASTIEQTILSVINQSYKNIEFIIVDGVSSDETLKIVEKYKGKISKFISEKDKGIYDAMNKGLEHSTGDVIGFLHSDDFYFDSETISKYVSVFEKQKCDAVYADLYYVDRNNTNKVIRKWKSGDYKINSFINGWMPPHPTVFIKKSAYQKFGLFNTDFKTAGDYELLLRFIHKNKISVSYLNEFTVKMRVGGKSNVTVQNRINANLEDRNAWKINNLKPAFYTLFLKPLRKILQYL